MPSSRAPRQRFNRNFIDLGVEPPLRADGDAAEDDDGSPVSLRWLAGTVLTALAGLGLMSGAVYAALDGTTRLAGAPDGLISDASRLGVSERRLSNVARKADRMTAVQETWEARQQVRLTSATRVGDREVIRIRPVTRLVARLATSTTDRISGIPPFNPASLMAEQTEPGRADQGPAADGDVSYVMKDMKSLKLAPNAGPTPNADDVLAQVRDMAESASRSRIQLASPTGSLGALDISAPDSPLAFPNLGLANVETTMVVAKRVTNSHDESNARMHSVEVTGPQRLEMLLQKEGASPDDSRAVAQAFGGSGGYGTVALDQGQRVEILMNADEANGPARPARVRIFSGGALQSAVALSDTGDYVAVDDASETDVATDQELDKGGATARLYESLYETVLRYDVPEKVTKELLRVLANDVDFQRRISAGDGLELVYSEPEVAVDMPEILYAAISFGGEIHRYYRFPGMDGDPDYFDDNGRSARKFLLRKPLTAGIMRSPFGARNHPILRYAKMHTGVDWAAPRGTPIYATGNGTVVKADWDGGYGRHVKLRHANGYETAYAHMNGFAKGIEAGVKVKQGQLIGYVGSTGLSTGPHVHYEVLVNGRFVDPMRIRVPREQELTGETLAAFQRERQRIETLMQPANGGQRMAAGR